MIYLDVQTQTAEVKSPSSVSVSAKVTPHPSAKKSPDRTYCPYCGRESVMIWVHSHYQCSRCKYIVVSCCESN